MNSIIQPLDSLCIGLKLIIKKLYKNLKDWFSLTQTLPQLSEVGKEKKSIKIAFVTTVAASLELAKRGEIYIKQNEECGEIFLKRK